MRTKDIEIKLKMPLRVDQPDENGITYTKDAVEMGCYLFKGGPIVAIDKDNVKKVIGVVDSIEFVEENGNYYALVSGQINSGGTCESVVTDEEGNDITVKGMTITCVGLNTVSQ